MLVLTRKIGEAIMIGDGIVLTVNRVVGNRVALGITAPDDVRVLRAELVPLAETSPPSEPSEERELRLVAR